jgi:hypothetical protein
MSIGIFFGDCLGTYFPKLKLFLLEMKVDMCTGYIDSLGTIHECKFIAETESCQCSAYEMKSPLKTGGNG